MKNTYDIGALLQAYAAEYHPTDVESLEGAGGFSGAQFWKLQTAAGPLCLRCWPADHPDPSRLTFIHRVLQQVAAARAVTVPVPIRSLAGTTFVEFADRLWQLEPWLPGRADFEQRPNSSRLTAAMQTLAQFHAAAENFSSDHPTTGPSPGITARLKKVDAWSDERINQLLQAIQTGKRAELLPVLQHVRNLITMYRAAAPDVRRALGALAQRDIPLQPCIRDIHDGHVLFQGDEVTGLIDFGSLDVDNPTCDVARLLGSLVGDDVTRRQGALIAYEELRPITLNDRMMVRVWDRSTTLLSGMNWLEWIFLDRREFEDYEAISKRLGRICERLATFATPC